MKVHFKRRGSGDTLILDGLSDHYFELQGNHLAHQTSIKGYAKRNTNDLVMDGLDYTVVEHELRLLTGQTQLYLEPFIESYSYYHPEHPEDHDFLNGVDISGLTVRQVLEVSGVTLWGQFGGWKERHKQLGTDGHRGYHTECVRDLLDDPPDVMLDIPFWELYHLIHDNHYREGFEELFRKVMTLSIVTPCLSVGDYLTIEGASYEITFKEGVKFIIKPRGDAGVEAKMQRRKEYSKISVLELAVYGMRHVDIDYLRRNVQSRDRELPHYLPAKYFLFGMSEMERRDHFARQLNEPHRTGEVLYSGYSDEVAEGRICSNLKRYVNLYHLPEFYDEQGRHWLSPDGLSWCTYETEGDVWQTHYEMR